VTRVLQFGSEPLFDSVLDPPVLKAQVLAAKANLSSLQIPVTVSDMAYSYQKVSVLELLFFGLDVDADDELISRSQHANDGGPSVLDAIDLIDVHMLPFFSTRASNGLLHARILECIHLTPNS
jgi:hypothetical protein